MNYIDRGNKKYLWGHKKVEKWNYKLNGHGLIKNFRFYGLAKLNDDER